MDNPAAPDPAVAPPPLPPAADVQPVPVQAIPYAPVLMAPRQPGILTGVSVMSLVVVFISLAASLMSGCQALGMYIVSRVTPTATTPAPINTPYSYGAPANRPPTVGSNGLDARDRATVTKVLVGKQPLRVAQREELETFLAEQGQVAFPTGGKPLTPSAVRASISDSGVEEGSGPADPGSTYYVTAWGTLKVSDTQAIWNSASHSAGVITTTSSGSAAAAATGPTTGPSAAPAPTFPAISGVAAALVGLDAVLSIALAVLLLVAAIVTLRESNAGRRLHLTYAVPKLLIAFPGAATLGWLYWEIATSGGPQSGASFFVGFALYGLAAALYPIALLIVFQRKTVREYYHGVHSPTA